LVRAVALVLMALLVSGCLGTINDGPKTSEKPDGLIAGEVEFALDLYGHLTEDGENVVFSPFSLHTALAMAYEGAGGKTAEEMAEVLHLPENDAVRRAGFRGLLQHVGVKLTFANALWLQRGFPVKEEYLGVVREYYLGEVREVDFINDPGGAERAINGWVEKKTNGIIKNLVSGLTPDTRLVITNAVHFKANWTLPFNPAETHNGTFKLSTGETIVPMMTRVGVFNYLETDSFQAIELPYSGPGNFSMVIILPRRVDGLGEIEGNLSSRFLLWVLGSMEAKKLRVTLPRFRIEGGYNLKDVLMEMGMRDAFTDRADFSGISDRPLAISDVVHKAFISVAENGTEAAAATAVVITLTAFDGNEEFRADHPFMFLVLDRETGGILFIGRLVNPRG